jgi:hypothetical protein
MKLFGWLERLINERGSAAIMEQRLALKDDEIAKLQSKIRDLEASLEKHRVETDTIRIHKGIEFHCGVRTGGLWHPYCPICHSPITISGYLSCLGCNWNSWIEADELPTLISELRP